MKFGLGLKLALGGFLKKLRFDKLKTQQERLEKLCDSNALSGASLNKL